MKQHYVLPDGVEFTSVPDPILGVVVDEIEDIKVLKTVMRIVWLYYKKKGFPRFLTLHDISGDHTIRKTLSKSGYGPVKYENLIEVLDKISSIGLLITIPVSIYENQEYIYILNTKEGRRAVELFNAGDIDIEKLPIPIKDSLIVNNENELGVDNYIPTTAQNIFKLYEQNIGIITPIVSEELKDAETIYPYEWIVEAFTESALLNKRSWRYIEAILKRWKTEGKQDGKSRGDTKKVDSREWIRRHGLKKFPS